MEAAQEKPQDDTAGLVGVPQLRN
jgi:hypothetical protein